MKKVSVIIPCYNVEKYIDRCVKSLVDQTLGIEEMELIFVNDASGDATYQKLCQWEAIYPDSILVINSKENRRQGGARNIGISYASADYIGFVDADDWVELDMYQKMYEKAIETGADQIRVLYQREDENGKIYQEETPYTEQTDILYVLGENGVKALPELPGGVWSGLYKKSILVGNNIYFPEHLVYEDNYWGAILRYYIKSVYIIGEVLYHYFVNWNSTIMQRESRHHLDRLTIEKMKLEELKKRGFYEENRNQIEFDFLRLYYINTLHLFFTRFQQVPYEIICEMQQEVMTLIPSYESNPYLEQLNWVEKFFLKTIRMKLSRETFEEIAQGYRADLKIAEKCMEEGV